MGRLDKRRPRRMGTLSFYLDVRYPRRHCRPSSLQPGGSGSSTTDRRRLSIGSCGVRGGGGQSGSMAGRAEGKCATGCRRKLSHRQLEILRWVSLGKSTRHATCRHVGAGCQVPCLEILRKLDVVSRAQAHHSDAGGCIPQKVHRNVYCPVNAARLPPASRDRSRRRSWLYPSP